MTLRTVSRTTIALFIATLAGCQSMYSVSVFDAATGEPLRPPASLHIHKLVLLKIEAQHWTASVGEDGTVDQLLPRTSLIFDISSSGSGTQGPGKESSFTVLENEFPDHDGERIFRAVGGAQYWRLVFRRR